MAAATLPRPDDALPEPPARLLVAAQEADVRRLEAAGHQVVRWTEGAAAGAESGTVPGEAFDAAWLDVAAAEGSGVLADLHHRLSAGGRLVVVGPPEALDAPRLAALTRSLAEAGFAVLGEATAADGSLRLVARATAQRIRPYQPGDETAILELFERAFHHRRSLPRWRWAYREAPYGAHRISVAVDGEGRLLAHYAGYPVRFWSDLPELAGCSGGEPAAPGDGAVLPALHIGDTMTAPEARRIGRGRTNLLTRTVAHFYATHCRGRVGFNYGTNTGKIQRFSRRTAGAMRVEDAPFRVRELDRPFDAPGGLTARLGGWRVERLAGPAEIDARWDELWRRCRGDYRFLLQRDRRYLAWRYACPDVEYDLWAVFRRRRLVGWSVFQRQGGALFWGDALFDRRQPRAAAVLLSRVVAAPVHRDVRRIEAWLTPRPEWWGRTVEALGFVARPEPEDLGLVYVPFQLDPGSALGEHLYYTKADFDLF